MQEDKEVADGMDETLQHAVSNFTQLARFAYAVLERRTIGTAILALKAGAEA